MILIRWTPHLISGDTNLKTVSMLFLSATFASRVRSKELCLLHNRQRELNSKLSFEDSLLSFVYNFLKFQVLWWRLTLYKNWILWIKFTLSTIRSIFLVLNWKRKPCTVRQIHASLLLTQQDIIFELPLRIQTRMWLITVVCYSLLSTTT
jgi:hypothetical protein